LSRNHIRHTGLSFFFALLLLTSCSGNGGSGNVPQRGFHADSKKHVETEKHADGEIEEYVEVEETPPHRFDSLGLVNIARLDTTIAVSLLYATPHNFVGEVLYDDLTEAYLHPEAADALVKAQRLLKEKHPDYRLIVYDATRPMAAQRKMWDLVKGTSKSIYVSNPARGGGLHNYGLAVDVSILDAHGAPLPMGTEVDHLGSEAHITAEAQLVKQGKISIQEKENRELLRAVMRGAGFRALPSEWWHFNLYSRETAKQQYTLIE
jgi:D-alanyl-D-alanine dipeptidase